MVERSLSMREVPGSIPGFSITFIFTFFFMKNIQTLHSVKRKSWDDREKNDVRKHRQNNQNT